MKANIMVATNAQLGISLTVYGTVEHPLFNAGEVALLLWNPKLDREYPRPNITKLNSCISNGNADVPIRSEGFITESQLYMAAMKSGSPKAEPFVRWLSEDVIPSIRKNGVYMTPETIEKVLTDPDTIIRLATDLKNERAARIEAQNKAAKLQSKADFVDVVMDSKTCIDIGQVAKVLSLPFGRNTLFENLRDMGVLFKYKNEPKQEFINRGYFKLKETFDHETNRVFLKVLVTQKGVKYIAELFGVIPKQLQIAI